MTDSEKLIKAQEVCAQAYQAIGFLAFKDDVEKEGDKCTVSITQEDWSSLLDILSDVANDAKIRHKNILPWPKGG